VTAADEEPGDAFSPGVGLDEGFRETIRRVRVYSSVGHSLTLLTVHRSSKSHWLVASLCSNGWSKLKPVPKTSGVFVSWRDGRSEQIVKCELARKHGRG
jgi:hypothetical protein